MKTFKRSLSIILSVFMLIGVFIIAPFTVNADTEETTEKIEENEEKIIPGFYVIGSEEVCGLEWENDNFAEVYKHSTPMAQATDGTFFKVYNNIRSSAGNVAAEGNNIYEFKVIYLDTKGNVTWHPCGMGNNTNVNVAEDGSTILFQFKLLASRPNAEGVDPEAVKATVYGPNDVKPSFEDPQYTEACEETTVILRKIHVPEGKALKNIVTGEYHTGTIDPEKGYWTFYLGKEENENNYILVDEKEDTLVPGFYIVGSEEVCGLEWENDNFSEVYKHSTPMTQTSDGTFFKVYKNIRSSIGNVTAEGNDIYEFKVIYLDSKGNVTWHPGGMGNDTIVKVIEDNSTILFRFKLLAQKPTIEGADPEAVKATVYGPNDEIPSFEEAQYTEPQEAATTAYNDTTAPVEEETTNATEAVKTRVFNYLPDEKSYKDGNSYKLLVQDTKGNVKIYNFIETPVKLDNIPVYSTEIPADINPVVLQYQVYFGENWISQITKNLDEIQELDGKIVKSDGSYYGEEKPTEKTATEEPAVETTTNVFEPTEEQTLETATNTAEPTEESTVKPETSSVEPTEETTAEPSTGAVEPTEETIVETATDAVESTDQPITEPTTSEVEPTKAFVEPTEQTTAKTTAPKSDDVNPTSKPSINKDNKKNNSKTPVKPKTKNTKKKNTLTVKAKTKTIKLKKLKKKAQTVKPLTVKNAKGKVTYKLIKKGTSAKIRKYLKISKKGVITVKKWKKAKKGTYSIKITITAAGNKNYKKGSKTATIKIKIK